MNYLTDTHALLWHFTDSPKISPKAKDLLRLKTITAVW